MAISSHVKASEAVARLQAWLKAGDAIPMRNGRLNKTELCRALDITRSTFGSNPRLRELIASWDKSQHLPLALDHGAKVSEFEREISALREENAELRRQLSAVRLLVTTGRSLRP